MTAFNCQLCHCRKIKYQPNQLICKDCFKENTGGGSNYNWLKFENERTESPTLQEIDEIVVEEDIKVIEKHAWLKIVGA